MELVTAVPVITGEDLTLIECLEGLRQPAGGTIQVAGPFLLILLGFIVGNDPDPMTGALGYLDVSVPVHIAMITGIVGLAAVPITRATLREMGVLRRFSAPPHLFSHGCARALSDDTVGHSTSGPGSHGCVSRSLLSIPAKSMLMNEQNQGRYVWMSCLRQGI
jgi:hypothetical protein